MFFLLEEFLPELIHIIAPDYTENWMIIFGPLLIAVVLFTKGGVMGSFHRLRLMASAGAGGHKMTSPILELKDVDKYYGALHATRAVSLTVEHGEIHALIGPNGAGKTTLITQIYGTETPDAGDILLCGEAITTQTPSQRVNNGIGRSFQISNVLLGFTVLENAIIAEQARRSEAFRFFSPAFSDPGLISGAQQILENVGLAERADRLVANISHGERRLLELALAMATNPSLLLLMSLWLAPGQKKAST